MGYDGLTEATKIAILNANYIARRLAEPLPGALHRAATGWSRTSASSTPGRSRPRRASRWRTLPSGSSTTASTRRRSPSRSPGTLMIEPTESESKEELDRFCDAMIAIREEIREIEEGRADRENNLLTNAPHTLEQVIADALGPAVSARAGRLSRAGGAGAQGLAHGGPDRQRLRRPQPGVHLPADGGVCATVAGASWLDLEGRPGWQQHGDRPGAARPRRRAGRALAPALPLGPALPLLRPPRAGRCAATTGNGSRPGASTRCGGRPAAGPSGTPTS